MPLARALRARRSLRLGRGRKTARLAAIRAVGARCRACGAPSALRTAPRLLARRKNRRADGAPVKLLGASSAPPRTRRGRLTVPCRALRGGPSLTLAPPPAALRRAQLWQTPDRSPPPPAPDSPTAAQNQTRGVVVLAYCCSRLSRGRRGYQGRCAFSPAAKIGGQARRPLTARAWPAQAAPLNSSKAAVQQSRSRQ